MKPIVKGIIKGLIWRDELLVNIASYVLVCGAMALIKIGFDLAKIFIA